MTRTTRCHFGTCQEPVTHTVQRLWKVRGETLPLQYSCDLHLPGSRARAGIDPEPSTFYRVERLTQG